MLFIEFHTLDRFHSSLNIKDLFLIPKQKYHILILNKTEILQISF